MQWQSMKTAPRDGTWVCVTLEFGHPDRHRWAVLSRFPYQDIAIAWHSVEPYTGTLEELDAEVAHG